MSQPTEIKLAPTHAAELRYWVNGISWGRPRHPQAAQDRLASLGLLHRITSKSRLYVATEAGRAWVAANPPKGA